MTSFGEEPKTTAGDHLNEMLEDLHVGGRTGGGRELEEPLLESTGGFGGNPYDASKPLDGIHRGKTAGPGGYDGPVEYGKPNPIRVSRVLGQRGTTAGPGGPDPFAGRGLLAGPGRASPAGPGSYGRRATTNGPYGSRQATNGPLDPR